MARMYSRLFGLPLIRGRGGLSVFCRTGETGKADLRKQDRFIVNHFAGSVEYCVQDFIEKNNDTLYADLEVSLRLPVPSSSVQQ